jgi:hypothetical protein
MSASPEDIQAWSAAVKTVFEIAKEAISAWPTDKKRADAEAALRMAELDIGVRFDYSLCRRHIPPGVMIEKDGGDVCLVCGFDSSRTTPTKFQTHGTTQSR